MIERIPKAAAAAFFLAAALAPAVSFSQEPDVKALIPELSDESAGRRLGAARKLGASRSPEAAEALAGGLKTEKNAYVRSRIVEAIGRRKGAAAELAGIARTDPDADSRLAAVKALKGSGEAFAAPVLIERFLDEGEALGIRLRAADALTGYPTDEVFSVFAAALGDRNAAVKRQALVSLYLGFGWDKQRVLPLVRMMAEDKETGKIAEQYLKSLGAGE